MADRPSWFFNLHDETAGIPRALGDGITARIFPGERVMLSVVHVEPNARGTIHSHPEEQWGLLLEGECIRIQEGAEVRVRAGDFWHTPAGVSHGIRSEGAAALILDIFSPTRKEYLQAGTGFGAAKVARPTLP